MTPLTKEIIRRLVKGDSVTIVNESSVYTFANSYYNNNGDYVKAYIGFNGSSPLSVSRKLFNYLIREGLIVCVASSEGYASQSETDYLASTKLQNVVAGVMQYSVGDTISYKCDYTKRNNKGVITKEIDPLGLEIVINGQNFTHSTKKSVIGITRKVLVEKTIVKQKVIRYVREEGLEESDYEYDDEGNVAYH